MDSVRVLVVEDHYVIATELSTMLLQYGFQVIGPFGNVAAAMAATAQKPDVALLDINLHGSPVFPVADRLAQLGIPFAFTSGYETRVLPAAYRTVPRLEKPFEPAAVADLVLALHKV